MAEVVPPSRGPRAAANRNITGKVAASTMIIWN